MLPFVILTSARNLAETTQKAYVNAVAGYASRPETGPPNSGVAR
jgi:hypothetical protein